jgi:hypothetical protein
MSASEPLASAARATDGPRYRGHPLAGALAFRRSVAALFSFGLRFLRQRADVSPLPCSEAPRGPVVMPDEQDPKPPERSLRNRTRAPRSAPSIGTPPVDALDEQSGAGF